MDWYNSFLAWTASKKWKGHCRVVSRRYGDGRQEYVAQVTYAGNGWLTVNHDEGSGFEAQVRFCEKHYANRVVSEVVVAQ